MEFLQGRQSILLHAPSLPSNVAFLLPGEYQMDTPPEVRYGLQVQYGLQVFCSLDNTVMWAYRFAEDLVSGSVMEISTDEIVLFGVCL